MARPVKDGVNYWPLDVGFFDDKKLRLIKGEFGLTGAFIALMLVNEVYRTGGYYKAWDDDDCLLMSESIGSGCTSALIRDVLNRCCERSLFDKRVFDEFGVITSRGIQRRYLRMTANNRAAIPICIEYWLLDIDDETDVPAATRSKLAFKSLSGMGKNVNLKENADNLTENAAKQSKVNQPKADESTTEQSISAHHPQWRDEAAACAAHYEFERIKLLTPAEFRRISELVELHGEDAVVLAIRDAVRKGGRSLAYVERIIGDRPRPALPAGKCAPTYDAEKVECYLHDEWFGDGSDSGGIPDDG